MNYTEKEIKEINTEYSFNNIDFTKLNIEDIYLIKVEVGTMKRDDMAQLCLTLKEKLAQYGVEKVLICPCRNGVPSLQIYKLEKE